MRFQASLLDLLLACIIFSPCLILNFPSIGCSVCLAKDTSSAGWSFIIVHNDGLSQTEGEATASLLAIKVKVQKTCIDLHLTLKVSQPV